ncbi:hypothetical protein [Ekhidna sp.]
MKTFFVLFSIIVSTVLTSCERPECNNENLIFSNYSPESDVYKAELASQLQQVDQSKLTYWLQKYEAQDEKESLYFYVQGDDLCAILTLTMNHWDRLENLREKKGVTYRGAEFTNLTFHMEKDSLSTEFIYKTHDSIID